MAPHSPDHPRHNRHSRHNRASLGASDTIGPNPNPYPSLNPDRDSGDDSGPNLNPQPLDDIDLSLSIEPEIGADPSDIDSSFSFEDSQSALDSSSSPSSSFSPSLKRSQKDRKSRGSYSKALAVTDNKFNALQLRALDVLIARAETETMQQLAEKVGVARMTLWRWLQNPEFKAEYRQRVESELGAHRGRIAQALVRGALTPGVGQAAMQKIYWQKLGEFAAEKLEITGKNGGPIAVTATSITLDALLATLSTQAKRDIIEILEREKVLEKAAIGAGISTEMLTLEGECDTVTDTVEAEYSISE